MNLKHTHTFRILGSRWNGKHLKKNPIFICDDPHCNFQSERQLIIGKASLCNNCHQEFILKPIDLKKAKPVCLNCANTKEGREFRAKKEAIQTLFGEDANA